MRPLEASCSEFLFYGSLSVLLSFGAGRGGVCVTCMRSMSSMAMNVFTDYCLLWSRLLTCYDDGMVDVMVATC